MLKNHVVSTFLQFVNLIVKVKLPLQKGEVKVLEGNDQKFQRLG